jgi:hypothetical protein
LQKIGESAGAGAATKPLAIISFGYNYLQYLKEERALHGDIGYQDEVVAFAQAAGNFALSNFVGGPLGTGTGALITVGNPVGVVGGYVVGGVCKWSIL